MGQRTKYDNLINNQIAILHRSEKMKSKKLSLDYDLKRTL